jgi:glycosyltransferase 2 family protein
MNSSLKRVLRFVATIVVLGLCVYAASRLDLTGAMRVLKRSHLGWVLLAAFSNFPYALLQAFRWRLLLDPAGRVPLLSLFRYLLASRAASNLLPARAGELLRVYLPRARDGLPLVTIASTLVIERCFDALGLAFVTLPLLWLVQVQRVRLALVILVGIGLGGLIIFFFFARRGSKKKGSLLDRLAESAETLRSPRRVTSLVGLTLLGWILFEVGLVLCCLAAAGLELSLPCALLVLLAANLGLVVQVTPANVGPFEATVILALAVFNIHSAEALAVALIYHLTMMVPVTLAGLEGLRFVGEARRAEQRKELEASSDASARG